MRGVSVCDLQAAIRPWSAIFASGNLEAAALPFFAAAARSSETVNWAARAGISLPGSHVTVMHRALSRAEAPEENRADPPLCVFLQGDQQGLHEY